MPMFWVVEPSRRLVKVVVTDPCPYEDWARSVLQIVTDPLFAPGFSALVDRRHARAPDPSFAHSQAAFFREHAALLGNGHYAIVVHPDDQEAFGMARMTEMITEHENPMLRIRTFRDMDAAEQWLSSPTEPKDWDPFR
jgi:hypothetical protein